MSIMLPYSQWKSWRYRVRHFTWAWHAVIMGTGITSGILHLFPYHNGSLALKIVALVVFIINLLLFVYVCGMTVARYWLYPEIWGMMIRHPAQSLFIGCFPMGAATLINAGLNVHNDWSKGGTASSGFLWTLWAFWWLDSAVSYAVAFGMLYAMMIHQDHSLAKMTATWLLPFVTLIVASSTGGLLSSAIKEYSHTLAIVTSGFSFTMVLIGLSFAMIIICVYCTRLITAGPPDASLILSAFIILGPLGQGGFSLLLNGQDLSLLLPLHLGGNFPQSALAGQMIFAGCFLGSYVLWSMGFAWIFVALISIWHVQRTNKLPFSMAYWGIIFPNGTFALLSVQLAKVLDSGFFRAFGAAWSVIVFTLWVVVFIRSIPSFIDGSMFKAPYVVDPPEKPASSIDLEKTEPSGTTTPANNSTMDAFDKIQLERPL